MSAHTPMHSGERLKLTTNEHEFIFFLSLIKQIIKIRLKLSAIVGPVEKSLTLFLSAS